MPDTDLGDGKETIQYRTCPNGRYIHTRGKQKSFQLDLSQLLQRHFYHKAQVFVSLHGISMNLGNVVQ